MALNWPLELQGSTGENVRSIQYLLNARLSAAASAAEAGTVASDLVAVDGIFGPKTEAAVRAFQAKQGLTVDGKVGNQTWPALIIKVSTGSTGDAVRAVQSQIRSRSGWLTVDGIFGPQTDNVVRSFQSFCNLSVEGIVGLNTWNRLTLAYLRASNGAAASNLVYQAWTKNDRVAAAYEAIPLAIDQIFARTWKATDGWGSAGCQGAAGSFLCTWQRTGETLTLEGNDSTGAPFYYVNNVTFQA